MSDPVGHNGILFDVDVEWGERRIDKSRTPVKNCHEMVVDRDNLIHMIEDHTRNNVLVYDSEGRLVRTFGTEPRYESGVLRPPASNAGDDRGLPGPMVTASAWTTTGTCIRPIERAADLSVQAKEALLMRL